MFSNKLNKKFFFIIVVCLIFSIHQYIFQHYLNLGRYHFDFQSVLSRLVFGKLWFYNNGLSVPWFTPHICCGLPFYANPQSEFYSLPQILIFFLKPIDTFKFLFFIYSLFAFFGMFLLLRKIFKIEYLVCLIGSTLFLFSNGYIFHFLSGHIAWGLTTLLPTFFLLCCLGFNHRSNLNLKSIYLILAGLFFALMIHGGGSRVLTDLLLSTFFMMLIHLYINNNPKIIYYTSIPILIGLIISSSKIYAALNFLKNIPERNMDHIYFNNPFDFVVGFVKLFFLIPDLDTKSLFVSPWNFSVEELTFGLTILPVLIFILYLRTFPKLKKNHLSKFSFYTFLGTILILVLANFSNTLIGSYIVKLPIIKLDWISYRLLVSLVIPICILSCFMFREIKFKNLNLAIMFSILIIIFQNILFDKNIFYKHLKHEIKELMNHDIDRNNYENFKIEKIYNEVTEDYEFLTTYEHKSFLKNKSVQFCYFPIFGYDLANLKPIVKDIKLNSDKLVNINNNKIRIVEGDPMENHGQFLNFINPSCYTNPNQEVCKDNYLFKSNQKNELIKFLNYKKFKFEQKKSEKFFNYLSIIALTFCILLLSYLFLKILRQKKTPTH